MATFLDEIQERLKVMEKLRAGKLRDTGSANYPREENNLRSHRSSTVHRPLPAGNLILKSLFLASSEEDNSRFKKDFNATRFRANKIRETSKAESPYADYLNYVEIVKLLETISEVDRKNVERLQGSKDEMNEMNFYPDDGSGRKRFIFDDIPREVLSVVDELILSGKDICQHFHVIDEIAFKPRVFHEKEFESDTDSGNGTMQTENGSLSSQTLHDEQKADGSNSNDMTSHHLPVRPSTTLSGHEFMITESREVDIDDSSKSPKHPRTFFSVLPPPLEFCEEKVACESRGMFVKGIYANRGALKKGLRNTPAVLDRIPGTFLSQSCIDLSQISPTKRKVTFADEVLTSVQKQNSLSDFDDEEEDSTARETIKSALSESENGSLNKWRPFKFLHKKQSRDKEKEAKTEKKFKKKSKNQKFCDEICEDPFSEYDFDDFSDDNDEFQTTNSKKLSENRDPDVVFLTAFDDSGKHKSFCEGLNYLGKTVSAPKTIDFAKLRHKKKNDLKRGSLDRFLEKESSLSRQARFSTPEISVHLGKEKSHHNPLKNLKLKLRQLRGKRENDKKVKPAIKHPMDLEESLKKDMEEALMNSDEECSDGNKSNKNSKLQAQKTLISFNYYPIPFSKKSVTKKNVVSQITKDSDVNSIYFSAPNSSTCEPSKQPSFETFLNPSKLKLKNYELKNKSEERGLFRIGFPSIKTPSQFKTSSDDAEERVQRCKKKGQADTSNSSNTTSYKFLTFSSAADNNKSSADIYSKKAIEIPLSEGNLLKSEQLNGIATRGSSGDEALYLNYADILLMRKLSQKTIPIPLGLHCDERTSFIKSKPLILKPKPPLDQIHSRDQSTIKSTVKIFGNSLQNCSIEKMLKSYKSMHDVRCKKAISHCDELSKHLRSLLRMEHFLPNKEHITANSAQILQNLRTICLGLVSSGKSMLITSTSSKTSFPEKVTRSIHLLADFSLELKRFAINCNRESDFRNLTTQFVSVVDLFELTIEACEEVSRNHDEATMLMKALLEMANDLAKGLATLLNTVAIISL